jgi:hypothetical protein
MALPGPGPRSVISATRSTTLTSNDTNAGSSMTSFPVGTRALMSAATNPPKALRAPSSRRPRLHPACAEQSRVNAPQPR